MTGKTLVGILLIFTATPLVYAGSVYTGTLATDFSGCGETQAATGPLIETCGPAEALANYTYQGVSGAWNGTSGEGAEAVMYDTVTVGGVAPGTQVDLTFLMSYDGVYSFTSLGVDGSVEASTTVLFSYNGTNIIDSSLGLNFCDPSLEGSGCNYYGTSLTQTAGQELISTTVVATAGTGVPVSLTFGLFVDGDSTGSLSADFFDPLRITDIEVTDPNTGQPIPGATLTGLSGTDYPANAVPEPSSLMLVGGALAGIAGLRRRSNGDFRVRWASCVRRLPIKALLLGTAILRCQAGVCPTYQPPPFDGRSLPIAFRNDGNAPVNVSLWQPQAPTVAFSTTAVSPGQNVYLVAAPSGVGDDWGISVGPSCILPVAAAAIYYPGANWQATGDANGGFTIPVSQTLTLSAPTVVGQGTITLNGGDSAKPTIPFAFSWGDGTFSEGFFPQTKTYSSGGTFPITVYAQYGTQNGFAMTTATIPGQDYYFSQLAFGGDWQTTVTYINYSPQAVQCTTSFYSDAGSPLTVPFPEGATSVRTDALPPGGSVHDQTTAVLTAPVSQGWAHSSCTGPIQASFLYRLFAPPSNAAAGEAGVNAETVPTTKFVTFAQTATGVAVANPSTTQSATLTLNVFSSTGSQLGSGALTLDPMQHTAFNVGPYLGLGSFTGWIEISSSIPIVSLSLNFEASPSFSSMPPGDLPGSTVIVP